MKDTAEPDYERTHQHLCSCHIDIANEGLTTIYRSEHDPVRWCEIRVLEEVHGENSVYDVRPVALAPRDLQTREKERLVLIYGRDVVEQVYAGKSFNMEWFVPGWPIDPAKAPKRKADRPKPPRIQKPDDGSLDARI